MPLIKGKKVIAFWSNPITLIPNLCRTKRTTPTNSNPKKRRGRRLGLFGLLSASITSPSITPLFLLLENSLDINSPTAINRTNMIINRSMTFIPVQTYKLSFPCLVTLVYRTLMMLVQSRSRGKKLRTDIIFRFLLESAVFKCRIFNF